MLGKKVLFCAITLSFSSFTFRVQAQDKTKADGASVLPQLIQNYDKKKYEEALKLFATADGKERSEADVLKNEKDIQEYVLFYWGGALLEMGKFEEAKKKFSKAQQFSPNSKLKRDLQIGMAKAALGNNNNKEALNLLKPLEKKMRREDGYVDVLSMLARAERATGRMDLFCKRMITIYEKFPHHPNFLSWTADMSVNKFDEKSIPCKAKFDDRSQRIRSLQLAGLSDRAWTEIQSLKNAEDKNLYEITKLEAQYFLHEGEVQQAMKALLPFYEDRKTDFNYLILFGQVSARSGEIATAVGSYYKAHKLNPRGKYGRQALYQSAFLSYQFQDYDGAAKKFEEFVKLYPRSGLSRDAKWQLAWIRYLKADYAGSYADMKKILAGLRKKASGSERLKYWMAMSLMKQQKYADSREYFEQLSKDTLNGFYSISAKVRLEELNTLSPRPSIARFKDFQPRMSAMEMLVPSVDDFSPVTEETESEETIAESPVIEPSVSEEAESEDTTMISAEGTTVELDGETSEEAEKKTNFANPLLAERFEKARKLRELGVKEWAKWDLYEIEKKTSNPEYLKALMAEYENLGVYNRSANIGQNNFIRQRAAHGIKGVRHLWESSYPKAYEEIVTQAAKDFKVPQELIWGIMKAESSFKADVVSPVGAMGLMQIMPYTGEKVAKLLKENEFKANRLFEPQIAIRYGARYLKKLSEEFEGNLAFIAAGYNAGPHRVLNWINSIGRRDLDEFIEHIPFLETRNYVKKVLSYAQTYRVLYNETSKDLKELGKPVDLRLPATIPTKEQW